MVGARSCVTGMGIPRNPTVKECILSRRDQTKVAWHEGMRFDLSLFGHCPCGYGFAAPGLSVRGRLSGTRPAFRYGSDID